MKRIAQSFILTLSVLSLLFLPFNHANAQSADRVFRSYEAIFQRGLEGGLEGLSACAGDAAAGFLQDVAGVAMNLLLDGISNLITGEVPVGEKGVRNAQKEIVESAKEVSIKEQCLDSIASGVAAQLLQDVTNNTINWINTLDDGAPAFVQDLNRHMLDIAYNEYRDYLRTSPVLASTCSVFRDEVIETLDNSFNWNGTTYYESSGGVDVPISETPCLLDQATGSEEATRQFLEGDFSKGGWEAWYAAFNDPASNRELAIETAANELNAKIRKEQQTQLEQLRWNQGYVSEYEYVCPVGSVPGEFDGECLDENGNPVSPEESRVVTPGSMIRTIADELATNEILRQSMADELSEVFTIAGQGLIRRIFQGGGFSNIDTETDPIQFGNSDLFSGAGEGGPGTGIFAGGNPAGALLRVVSDQLENEGPVLASLTQIRDRFNQPDVTSLITALNSCPYVANTPDVQADFQAFASIPAQAVVPGSTGSSMEIGPQKVDWAGNDFEWVEGQRYGLSECSEASAGGPEDRLRYKENPRYSYYVARVATGNGGYEFRWIITTCRVVDESDGGSNHQWKRVTLHQPLAFRDPVNNKVKIDWEGNEMEWLILDRYEGDRNRYLFTFCDATNEGEESYHVGKYTRKAVDRAIQFELEPGSLNNWYKSRCLPEPPYNNAGFSNDNWNYEMDHWVDAERVGPAFLTLPSNQTSIDARIVQETTLVGELTTLKAEIEAMVARNAPAEEYEAKQREFNALRSLYSFSDSREASRLNGLFSDIEGYVVELGEVRDENC